MSQCIDTDYTCSKVSSMYNRADKISTSLSNKVIKIKDTHRANTQACSVISTALFNKLLSMPYILLIPLMKYYNIH